MRLSSLLILSLFAAGCSYSGTELTRYHEDGRAKPAVVVTQMIDTSSFDVPWSLSEELTTLVSRSIAQNRSLYVSTKEELGYAENPFGQDLSWAKQELKSYEFAVFMELVDHSFNPSNNLNMAVRVRVVDLRGPEPKVILQEMVKQDYYVPRNLLPTDYNTVTWGTPDYRATPLNAAHLQLAQEISSRLGDYILLAKSR